MSYGEPVCRLGAHLDSLRSKDQQLTSAISHHAVASSSSQGAASFVWVNPGSGRTAGLSAEGVGATLELVLRSSTLSAGFISVGFERGYRNIATLGMLTCHGGCSCAAQVLNATSREAHATLTQLSTPTWATLVRHRRQEEWACPISVTLIARGSGRLMISAATLSTRNSTSNARRHIGIAMAQQGR